MKSFTKTALAGVLLAAAANATAGDIAFNAALTSDYRFRGISQSAEDPALQGGLDYTDKSGFYFGVWGSTIDFDEGTGTDSDADIEVDLYGGYKFKASNIDWDAGFIYYGYPGSESNLDLDFWEIYFGGTYGPVFAKYYFTDDFSGNLTTKSAHYLTAGASLDLGQGFTLGMSIGKSFGDGIKEAWGDEYLDYKIGVSKDFAGFTFNVSYIDTDLKPEITTDLFNSEGTVVLTVSKTF